MARKILITGGTGFLGQRLAKQLKSSWDVTITGRNNKQGFLAEKATGVRCIPMDVSQIESVRDAVNEAKPDIIIHAAATKFVDLSERQPMECVDINVVGSQNVARVAVDRKVSAVIGISTDKAAPPVRNIYGMSKAVMERIFCSMDAKSDTRFMCVRYGNVAWSTGSVFPIWRKMLQETGVIQSTGPDMTRYFFSIEDAAQLVLTALDNVDRFHGKVLSLAMKSAAVRDILDVWIKEQGGRWETIAGRPGDRNFECLIGDLELDYTEVVDCKGKPHYLISFNQKVAKPLTQIVSSDTSEKLSHKEISKLLNDIPPEAGV